MWHRAHCPSSQKETSMRIKMVAVAGMAAIALGAAACSSSSAGTNGGGTPSSASASGGGAVVKSATIGGVAVVTSAKGFTLYSFAPDTATTSKCSGACAQI